MLQYFFMAGYEELRSKYTSKITKIMKLYKVRKKCTVKISTHARNIPQNESVIIFIGWYDIQ